MTINICRALELFVKVLLLLFNLLNTFLLFGWVWFVCFFKRIICIFNDFIQHFVQFCLIFSLDILKFFFFLFVCDFLILIYKTSGIIIHSNGAHNIVQHDTSSMMTLLVVLLCLLINFFVNLYWIRTNNIWLIIQNNLFVGNRLHIF